MFIPLSPSSGMSCPQQLLHLPSLLPTFLLGPDGTVQWPQSPLHLQGGLPLLARLRAQWAAVCDQESVRLHQRLRQLLPREWGWEVGVGTPRGWCFLLSYFSVSLGHPCLCGWPRGIQAGDRAVCCPAGPELGGTWQFEVWDPMNPNNWDGVRYSRRSGGLGSNPMGTTHECVTSVLSSISWVLS